MSWGCVLGLVFRVCARAHCVGACFLCSFPVCVRKFRRIICKSSACMYGDLCLHEGHREAICIYVSIWCLLVISFHFGLNIAYVCCSWQRSKCFSININYKSWYMCSLKIDVDTQKNSRWEVHSLCRREYKMFAIEKTHILGVCEYKEPKTKKMICKMHKILATCKDRNLWIMFFFL